MRKPKMNLRAPNAAPAADSPVRSSFGELSGLAAESQREAYFAIGHRLWCLFDRAS